VAGFFIARPIFAGSILNRSIQSRHITERRAPTGRASSPYQQRQPQTRRQSASGFEKPDNKPEGRAPPIPENDRRPEGTAQAVFKTGNWNKTGNAFGM